MQIENKFSLYRGDELEEIPMLNGLGEQIETEFDLYRTDELEEIGIINGLFEEEETDLTLHNKHYIANDYEEFYTLDGLADVSDIEDLEPVTLNSVNQNLAGLREEMRSEIVPIEEEEELPIEYEEEETETPEIANNSRIMNISEIKKIKDFIPLTMPRTNGLFKVLNPESSILVWGLAGSMKSTLCLMIADDWSKHGKTLYNTTEESLSSGTLKNRLKNAGVFNNKKIDFADYDDFPQLVNAIEEGQYKFVIIDSVTKLKNIPKLKDDYALNVLRQALKGKTSFVFVAQNYKAGNTYVGDNLGHDTDVQVRCEAGIAKLLKNRDAPIDGEYQILGGDSADELGQPDEAKLPTKTLQNLFDGEA